MEYEDADILVPPPAGRGGHLERERGAGRARSSKFVAVLLTLLFFSGCALNMRLLEDGKVHQGKYSPATRSMEATIDGDFYSGPISQGMAVGLGTAFSGRRSAFGVSTVATGDWQGLLTNSAGKVIRCQFNAAFGTGQGICQDNNGRTYDLVIGGMGPPSQPAGPKPAAAPTAPAGIDPGFGKNIEGRCS